MAGLKFRVSLPRQSRGFRSWWFAADVLSMSGRLLSVDAALSDLSNSGFFDTSRGSTACRCGATGNPTPVDCPVGAWGSLQEGRPKSRWRRLKLHRGSQDAIPNLHSRDGTSSASLQAWSGCLCPDERVIPVAQLHHVGQNQAPKRHRFQTPRQLPSLLGWPPAAAHHLPPLPPTHPTNHPPLHDHPRSGFRRGRESRARHLGRAEPRPAWPGGAACRRRNSSPGTRNLHLFLIWTKGGSRPMCRVWGPAALVSSVDPLGPL